MKPRHIVFAVIVALAVAPRWSAAQPADSKVSPAAEASARAHFQRGQRLGANGDFIGAYGEFAAGYALTERPLFLFNMAEAARANGDLAKARTHYAKFIHDDPTNALVVTAQARIDEIDHAAAPPAPTAPAAASAKPATPTPATAAASAKPATPTPAPATAPAAASAKPATPTPATAAASAKPATPAPATAPTTTTSPPPAQRGPITLLPPVLATTTPSSAPPAPPETAGVPANQLATRNDSPEAAPVWKRWPFWAVVGGVVAGSVIVFAVSRSGGDSCGGTSCSQLDFR